MACRGAGRLGRTASSLLSLLLAGATMLAAGTAVAQSSTAGAVNPASGSRERIPAASAPRNPAVSAASAPAAQEPSAPVAQEPPAEAQPPAPEPPVPEPPRFVSDVVNTLGDVAGDVFAWGQTSSVTGRVLDNAFLAGQLAGLDGGEVGGDLFLFAASARIDGQVLQDVYAFTSQLVVGREGVVHGNVMAFAGGIRIEGRVRGKLLGSGGVVTIDGELGGGEIEAGTLRIGPNARIRGDLVYKCDNEPTVDPAAVIEGDLRAKEAPPEEPEEAAAPARDRGFSWWGLAWKAWWYLGNLLLGLFCLLLGGRAAREPARQLARQPASGLGLGFVVSVVTPVACLLAMLLVVSLPLGVIGLVAFALVAFLGRLVTAQFVGEWLLRRGLGQGRPSEYLALAVGLLVLLLLTQIPYVGFLVRLVAILLGVGAVYLALRAAGLPSSGSSTGSVAPAPSLAD